MSDRMRGAVFAIRGRAAVSLDDNYLGTRRLMSSLDRAT
jgi:hypothetical protein